MAEEKDEKATPFTGDNLAEKLREIEERDDKPAAPEPEPKREEPEPKKPDDATERLSALERERDELKRKLEFIETAEAALDRREKSRATPEPKKEEPPAEDPRLAQLETLYYEDRAAYEKLRAEIDEGRFRKMIASEFEQRDKARETETFKETVTRVGDEAFEAIKVSYGWSDEETLERMTAIGARLGMHAQQTGDNSVFLDGRNYAALAVRLWGAPPSRQAAAAPIEIPPANIERAEPPGSKKVAPAPKGRTETVPPLSEERTRTLDALASAAGLKGDGAERFRRKIAERKLA